MKCRKGEGAGKEGKIQRVTETTNYHCMVSKKNPEVQEGEDAEKGKEEEGHKPTSVGRGADSLENLLSK